MEMPAELVRAVQLIVRAEREIESLGTGSLWVRMAHRARIEELGRDMMEALSLLGAAACDAAREGAGSAFAEALTAALGAVSASPGADAGPTETPPPRLADEWSENPTTASLQFVASRQLVTAVHELGGEPTPAPAGPRSPEPVPVEARIEEPEAFVAERPRPAVLTQQTVDELKRKLSEGRVGREVQTATQEREAVRTATLALIREMFDRFGHAPTNLRGRKPVQRELAHLLALIETELERWAAAPRHVNHALTSWTAARARALQDALGSWGEPGEDAALDRLFPRLGEHSRESQPGAVHGLARHHTPRGDSWMSDAQQWDAELREQAGLEAPTPLPQLNNDDALRRFLEDVREGMDGEAFARRVRELLAIGVSPSERRLVRAAIPYGMELDGSEFALLRRALAHEVADDARQEDASGLHVPADWPWLQHTSGRRAAIVGGDPRPERVARLREAFGFAELEWIDNAGGGLRHADALVQRMHNGTVELVIVLRAFSSHKLSDKIFGARDSGCGVVLADTYGITAVQLGIERYLEAASEPERS